MADTARCAGPRQLGARHGVGVSGQSIEANLRAKNAFNPINVGAFSYQICSLSGFYFRPLWFLAA
jgi:hypothetical protein